MRLGCRQGSTKKAGKSLIALCGSGIGGSNGHVVLESPPEPELAPRTLSERSTLPPYTLFMAGGLSPRSATSVIQDLQDLIITYPDHRDFLSMTYARRCRQLSWRSFAVHTNTTIASSELLPKFSTPSLAPREKPPVVFVFAGQGPQHLDMGRELFEHYPVFQRSILEMDQVYEQMTGSSLIATTGLFRSRASGDDDNDANRNPYPVVLGEIWPIEITLPAIAMLQCALVDLFAHIGVFPDAVVGHSAGETAVLYASGATSKAMAVELAIARGQAMSTLETRGGTMAALSCGIDEAQQLLSELNEEEGTIDIQVDIGCHNSQDAVTLSGLSTQLDKVIALADKRGILGRKLRTRVPVHSRMVEPCHDDFFRRTNCVWERHELQGGVSSPRIPVYSATTGGLFENTFSPQYYWDGTRGPVLFTEAVTSLLERYPSALALEISPHPVLSSYLSSLGFKTTISCLKRAKKRNERGIETCQFLAAIGQLTVSGVNSVDFSALTSHPRHVPDIRLPAYPFTPKSISYHSETPSYYRQFEARNGPLNFPGLRINSQTHPVLAEHVIKGEPIMPAAGFMEMALEFGANTIWDVKFHSMLSLSQESPIPVDIKLDGLHWSVRTSTASGHTKVSYQRTSAVLF